MQHRTIRPYTAYAFFLVNGLILASAGCGAGGEDTSSSSSGSGADSGSGGSGAAGTSSGGTGNLGGSIGVAQGGAGGGDEPCAAQSAEATLINRPIDVIFIVDNSGSMGAEIDEVEREITQNFSNIIDNADPPVDYRVILISDFNTDQSICIAEPLGGKPDVNMDGECDNKSTPPANTAKFFHHSVYVQSHDSLCQALNYYDTSDEFGLQPGGWSDVLREEAFKVFVEVTDDGVSCSGFNDSNNASGGGVGQAFENALFALDPVQFGNAQERNYVFHSIVALAPYDPNNLALPWPPTAPITTAECTPSAVDPGTGYQDISILSGGLRYPTCGLDYTPIFQEIAAGIIEGAAVPCEFEIPPDPPGEEIDLDTVIIVYTPGGGMTENFLQVDGPGNCDANSFYIDEAAGTISLCPAACDAVSGDDDAAISLEYGCEGGIAE